MDGPKGAGEGDAAEEAGDGLKAVERGKKSEWPAGQHGGSTAAASDAVSGAASTRMMSGAYDRLPGAKARVVYHDPTTPRPQDVYQIRVNNCNSPFDHVWLERSQDSTRPIHPLVSLSFRPLVR
jgi:exosome complex exonuclease RRP6